MSIGHGSLVTGWRSGGTGSGKLGKTLYQWVGISFSDSMNLVCSIFASFRFLVQLTFRNQVTLHINLPGSKLPLTYSSIRVKCRSHMFLDEIA